jgi:type III restriction enzyme
MAKPFYEQPILNSPYFPPTRHHSLGEDGQPLDQPPIHGRRESKYVTPVPAARRARARNAGQADLDLDRTEGEQQGYNPSPIINEIRRHLESWRQIPNPNDWGVTPATQRLLQYWRTHQFNAFRPFFCQLEAVETAIWLTEVARGRRQYGHIFRHLEEANKEANPDLYRLALKLATGAGKTTVMAMIIAWQAINAARQPNSSLFSRGFLIITPGITIKDRLRVLLPFDPDNYYGSRELVPQDLLRELGEATIEITNYHAFQRRRRFQTNSVGERLIDGRTGEPVEKLETEGEMLARACRGLLSMRNVVVINDEAHHCYREKPPTEEEKKLRGEDREEAEKNSKAARLWISGIEALKRKKGIRAVYDLSATPFFLRGSGYEEGTLFPWVVSDFSLVDAIECGIVKLPRVPVSDNAINQNLPVYRNLWDHIGTEMPKKGVRKAGELSPYDLPKELQTALYSLYTHYKGEFENWQRANIGVPPVFIVVCNNTASSKLVYEWISGWDREVGGETKNEHRGHLELFRNYDEHGNRLPRMNTLLIDSEQIESGDALDATFRQVAAAEIDQFRREKAEREGASSEAIPDNELLREVMNTVGKEGRLGEQIRCVVSVSMLTEGWDANTVTHIVGVRAFGTQLLCEQVIGRALRRLSYDHDEEAGSDADGHPLFGTEYADILGIPFDFASEQHSGTRKTPRPVTRVFAVRERDRLAIRFPRVAGYRTDMPGDRITATFTDDSKLELNQALVGPCTTRLEGLVGEGHDISPAVLDDMRANTVAVHLTKRLVERYLREGDEPPPYHLYYKIQPITRRWIRDCLVLKGGTKAGMLTYVEIADMAADLIHKAIMRDAGADGSPVVKAMLDPYNPAGSTSHVNFITSKQDLYRTAPDRCHINYVACDSDWEAEFARVAEAHPATISYVKNQALGFDVPYSTGGQSRRYLPDFIVALDDGNGADDPLHLVVEIKGYRGLDAQFKAETMRTLWVPGVNNLGTFGRWAFGELRDGLDMEDEYGRLVDELTAKSLETV